MDLPESKSQLPPILSSLLIEGIAQNTTGSVFVPEVSSRDFSCFFFLKYEKCNGAADQVSRASYDLLSLLFGREVEI